jgi:hypothetical protein
MKHFTLLLAAALPTLALAQVGVGTSTPDASAALEVASTTKGFLPPRMTATQRAAISSPATGMMVYQTDGTAGLYVYSGSAWVIQADWYTNTGTPSSSFALNTPAGLQSGATANYGIGAGALNALTTGDNNTALGYDAAKAISTNGNSTAVGYSALSAATGSGNTALGRAAGSAVTSGTNNTLIGNQADVTSNNLTNATAIGYAAEVTASNTVQLGNSSVTKVNTSGSITTSGSIGIGTTSPASNAALEISSTSKGLLLPRMTTSQRDGIPQPPAGLMVYNTSTNQFQGFSSGTSLWLNIDPTETYGGATASWPGEFDMQTITASSSLSIESISARCESLETANFTTASTTATAKIYAGVFDQNASPQPTPLGTSSTVTVSGAAQFRTFTFASPINVTSNSVYSIVITNTGGTNILYVSQSGANGGDPYLGGSQFGQSGLADLLIKIYATGQWVNL